MGTADRRGGRVQTDDAHQVPHAEFLARQRDPGPALGRARVGRVEEQLGGVVPGLAVDLHEPGEVRRPGLVEPVVVREPRVRLGHEDQFAGPFVVQAVLRLAGLVQDERDSGQPFAEFADGRQVGGIPDVHVGDLVVGDRERAGGPRVQVLHAGLGVDVQQPLGAQRPVHVDGSARLGDAVLRQHHHGCPTRGRRVQQRRQDAVQLSRGPRRLDPGRPEALEVVVEVRDVHEGQVGVLRGHEVLGRAADPPGGRQARARPPVGEQREGTQRVGQLVVQLRRIGVAVRFLAAVGVVDRARGHRPVDVGSHRVPPTDVGHRVAGVGPPRRVPQLVPTHQPVVLPPQQHLTQIPEVPTVSDDAVLAGRGTGQQRGLHRTGDRRQDRAELRAPAGVGDGGQLRHVCQQFRRQPDDIEDDERGRSGHGCSTVDSPRARSSSRVKRSSAAMPSASCAGVVGRRPGGSTLQV